MKRMQEYTTAFVTGAVCYSILEILWRGFTHWTMAITGGICFLLFHAANIRFEKQNIWARCSIGCLIITMIELLAGCTVNMLFRMNVWDYSGFPFNLWGQICLLYSGLWFLLGIPMCYVSKALSHRFDRQLDVGSAIPLRIMKDQG